MLKPDRQLIQVVTEMTSEDVKIKNIDSEEKTSVIVVFDKKIIGNNTFY